MQRCSTVRFIRYGIDYYFQKLEQQPEQTEHKE